jgi:hypothetical protein
MGASIIKPLAGGFLIACVVTGIWIGVAPAPSSATAATDVATESEAQSSSHNKNATPSDDANNATGALAALDSEVNKIQRRYQSIDEAYQLLNKEAREQSSSFRRLSLVNVHGTITAEMDEVTAPISENRHWMKQTSRTARKTRKQVNAAMKKLNFKTEGKADRETVIKAVIEMAFISESEPPASPAAESLQTKRTCQLLDIVLPHLPKDERSGQLNEVHEACRAYSD